jgi:hypothetical protein
MWRNVVAKAQELIRAAEKIKHLSGPEKKAYVVKGMCSAINIPCVPDWIEALIEPVLYGWIVDAVVKWWNTLTNHQLETLPANAETAVAMAEVVIKEAKGEPIDEAAVNAKFDELLTKYGVASPV